MVETFRGRAWWEAFRSLWACFWRDSAWVSSVSLALWFSLLYFPFGMCCHRHKSMGPINHRLKPIKLCVKITISVYVDFSYNKTLTRTQCVIQYSAKVYKNIHPGQDSLKENSKQWVKWLYGKNIKTEIKGKIWNKSYSRINNYKLTYLKKKTIFKTMKNCKLIKTKCKGCLNIQRFVNSMFELKYMDEKTVIMFF